ncbi:hypothetical protein NQ317_001137 [Molorchus minor]|uniref:THAP-type domain-containing protein n=1 Tax=Molorchus minor TaxID=1323400 RepID=A0ABQ9J7H0_9CUCU|nr:hypothetical protein NQ317_001137 [Molorchus minor]
MSKVCCVSQCPSKSGSVENTRNLFGINRDSPTYDSVLNAIGQNLKQKVIPKHLFICDLHFEDNCIERTDIKIWKDGEEVSIPRKIARLKAGSLPTIFPSKFSKENNECRKEVLRPVNVNNETANTQQISPTEPLQKNEASVDKYFPSEVTGMEQKDQDSENDEFLTSPVAPRMVKPAPGCTSFTSSANYVKDESLRPRICFNQNCTPFETQYTLEALMQDWKSSANERKVPGDWALVDSNFGVLLVYCGDTHESITRSVLVKNDMSVEVRYKERIAASPSIDKVSNFQQLLWFLLVVTCSHVCEGIENHQSCPNVFYIRKPKTRCNRCPDCQIEAKKHRRREQRRILREEKEEKVVKDSRYVKFALSADENICYNCHKTLDNFARFIHRCNTVKVTLDDIKIEIDEAISSDEDDTPELSKPLSEAISLDEDDKPELFKSLSEAISLDEDDKQELFNPLSEAISLDEDDKPEPFNPFQFFTHIVSSPKKMGLQVQ